MCILKTKTIKKPYLHKMNADTFTMHNIREENQVPHDKEITKRIQWLGVIIAVTTIVAIVMIVVFGVEALGDSAKVSTNSTNSVAASTNSSSSKSTPVSTNALFMVYMDQWRD